MPKPYNLLRQRIKAIGYTAELLSEELGHSPRYVSDCMCSRIKIRLSEAYRIMELLDIPHYELHMYFPADGKTIIEPERKKATEKDVLRLLADVINAAG